LNARGLKRSIISQFCPDTTSQPDLDDTVYDVSEFLMSALALAKTYMYVM
jgi:hypothetical protein